MPHAPFSQSWASSFMEAINSDPAYASAAKNWRWPLALVCDAEPSLGFTESAGIELDLNGGRCERAEAKPGDTATSDFILRGPYHVWKSLVKGETDPVNAVMKGDLKLAKGNLMTLMMHVPAARALLACATKVDTAFPDELLPS